jgi:hypothetical protein
MELPSVRRPRRQRKTHRLTLAHGAFNVVGGAWPLLNLASFEWVFGPKTDDWLQRTSAGLLMSAGWSQLLTDDSPEGRRHARRVGIGTALTLLAVDLTYVPKGRLRWTYLLDGLMEAAWIVAWLRATDRP